MEINTQAAVGICTEYMKDGASARSEVSVVIAPLKIIMSDDESRIQVISGCNLWRSCHNPDCWYSLACRDKKKA